MCKTIATSIRCERKKLKDHQRRLSHCHTMALKDRQFFQPKGDVFFDSYTRAYWMVESNAALRRIYKSNKRINQLRADLAVWEENRLKRKNQPKGLVAFFRSIFNSFRKDLS